MFKKIGKVKWLYGGIEFRNVIAIGHFLKVPDLDLINLDHRESWRVGIFERYALKRINQTYKKKDIRIGSFQGIPQRPGLGQIVNGANSKGNRH
jgi:hypothetical protein